MKPKVSRPSPQHNWGYTETASFGEDSGNTGSQGAAAPSEQLGITFEDWTCVCLRKFPPRTCAQQTWARVWQELVQEQQRAPGLPTCESPRGETAQAYISHVPVPSPQVWCPAMKQANPVCETIWMNLTNVELE